MNSTVDAIEILKNVVIAASTDGGFDEQTFADLRQRLLNDEATKTRLPAFMRTCRNLGEVRRHMQLLGGYHERRTHIREAFAPVLDRLEGLDSATVASDAAAARLDTWDSVKAA
ncbi:MAG: hypothetical protein WCJ30_16330, partial [Deltaproteobacteria bacterium]